MKFFRKRVTERMLFRKMLAFSTVVLVGGLLIVGAYQPSGLSQASQSYLDSLYATLSDTEKRHPRYAVAGLNVAPGLEATLFASEPMLTNPTNIDVDARGRVWVCEAYNYRPDSNGNPTRREGDRIVILEDANGDGKADLSKIFYQGPDLQSPLGIWVMGNRVIVSNSPNVYILTDSNGDDKADKKEILFTGISGEQHDHGVHTFVFGPDGKLYFTVGNEGKQIHDKNGRPLFDHSTGKEINNKSYRQGMVLRCNLDGTELEVLGHNFRNNYEVAVDSYGTLWQSDSDDKGNKGVRINYVMEYGNYGYTDELTGASWQANRTNIESDIPLRHWHLNDPGVVPNLLQTGAGSPTGIIVYEGNLLPQPFRNQIIHCDAGLNIVRAYPVQHEGAGYKATSSKVVEGTRDHWFRPSDVCIAPDGSLIMSDWYDSDVGGHQANDQERGRIFRIAPLNTPYKTPEIDLSTAEGAIQALKSPNMAIRYQAWNKLDHESTTSEKALAQFYKTATDPRMKARVLWLLSRNGKRGKKYIETALQEVDPNLRITALRAARSVKLDVIPYVRQLVTDPDPQVRRECLIALHRNTSIDAPNLWAQLAAKHDGKDRWYLEAIGIGADGQWDRFYSTWIRRAGVNPIATSTGRDIVWRARTKESVLLLARLAGDISTDLSNRLRYFRAFDFNPGATEKSNALVRISKTNSNSSEITRVVLRHLDPEFVRKSPIALDVVTKAINDLYGTAEYIELVTRYEPMSENRRLVKMAVEKSDTPLGRDAVKQLLKQGGKDLVWETINGGDDRAILGMITSLRWVGNDESLAILKSVALDEDRSFGLRREAIRAIGGSYDGEELILEMLKTGQIDDQFKSAAVHGVSTSWRKAVRQKAANYLSGEDIEGNKLPEIPKLLTMKGDSSRGLTVFRNNCSSCHQINGEGMDFGPRLSTIGNRLPKEGYYLAILYPEAGISFGYEGWEVRFKDGSTVAGIIASKTETNFQMKFPGGIVAKYKMSDVISMKTMGASMMPSGFHENMSTQELVDLVDYLASFKEKY